MNIRGIWTPGPILGLLLIAAMAFAAYAFYPSATSPPGITASSDRAAIQSQPVSPAPITATAAQAVDYRTTAEIAKPSLDAPAPATQQDIERYSLDSVRNYINPEDLWTPPDLSTPAQPPHRTHAHSRKHQYRPATKIVMRS